MNTLDALALALREGKTTSRQLVEEALARVNDPIGEGPRAFVKVDADGARAAADFYDGLRKRKSFALGACRHSLLGEGPF